MLQNGILAFDRTMKIVNEAYQDTYNKPYGFIKAKNRMQNRQKNKLEINQNHQQRNLKQLM